MVIGRSTMVLGRCTMVLGWSTMVLGSSTMDTHRWPNKRNVGCPWYSYSQSLTKDYRQTTDRLFFLQTCCRGSHSEWPYNGVYGLHHQKLNNKLSFMTIFVQKFVLYYRNVLTFIKSRNVNIWEISEWKIYRSVWIFRQFIETNSNFSCINRTLKLSIF